MRLDGKKALVTGAAQGLGAAIASRFVAEGARVVLTDIQTDKVQALAAELGDRATATGLDVTDETQWQDAVNVAGSIFGGLDILVNNAGVFTLGNVRETSLDAWRSALAINLDGVFLGCRTAMPLLADGDGGVIINISSISGIVAGHNLAAYNASKAAVRHLSKSVALDGARLSPPVRCVSLHPAFVETPMLDPLAAALGREQAIAKLARQVPLGRIGTPDEVAAAALFLASDEAAFITGTELILDGGLSAQ